MTDIRDKAFVTPGDILALNFIRRPDRRLFRKHFRSGLRSHVTEILNARDVEEETRGRMVDGVRRFPPAKPGWILRIFRRRFTSLDQILEDIGKYKLVLKFLGPHRIARSEEFVADYDLDGVRHMVLCGLQEYIDGEILDPWGLYGTGYLADLLDRMPDPEHRPRERLDKTRASIRDFVDRTREMVRVSGYIPDLAGIGNLLITQAGEIKLVDINNIVPLGREDEIPLDDKGYPSCDKSIETLAILETRILGRTADARDPLYGRFLAPRRRRRVRKLEAAFYETLRENSQGSRPEKEDTP